MSMMITEILLLTCSSLLIILVHFLHTSHASQMNSPFCNPSACGVIHNISFPFRLKDDPKHCGYSSYELACENNITSMYLNSQKYNVKAINYDNQTIRLADVSIKNYSCSFPKYSAYEYSYPHSTGGGYLYDFGDSSEVAWPINFVSCPYPLNSSVLTETTDCTKGDHFSDASNSSNGRHTYIKVGHMNASDVKYMCRVDVIVMTSWKFKDVENVSLSEIHESLLYGFDLSWFNVCCDERKGRWVCSFSCVTWSEGSWLARKLIAVLSLISGVGGKVENRLFFRRSNDSPLRSIAAIVLFVLLIIQVVLFAAVSLAAKIIIGLTFVFGLIIFGDKKWLFNTLDGPLLNLLVITEVNFSARFIIAFPCMVGLLIYKFRRRHLSLFDAIENFLQSDNKLIPIRYSYADIKKMTRGFQEKLGEGGYGSVYKGRLRSGHDVAVKLLGKSGANGQDFINEIATIGRIHHVNVVKLVGYCAERSKRALVFDFMPNGSLEKYIFSQEKMNSLNWKRKFEIAVGVARGIQYLHQGCNIQILHFDIKPHNILLDDKFIPKISDFGLAKFCSTQKNTVTLTAARGTIGYVAPELINRGFGRVSYKADVYSFGMLLIDMVGLKRDLKGNNEASSKYFPYWIYDCFNQHKDIEIREADENDNDDNDSTRKIFRKMTIVALWCIQMSPDDRPSMNKVLEMLEGEVEHLQIPPQPAQSSQVAGDEDQTWTTFSTDSVSLLCRDVAPNVEIIVQDV